MIDGDKDVENSQPAYDDHMTRQFLVQVLPNAPLSELEEKRAWIAGEGPTTEEQVKRVLSEIQREFIVNVRVENAIVKIAGIVGYEG